MPDVVGLNLVFLDPLVAGVRVVATQTVAAILRACAEVGELSFRVFTTRQGEACLQDDAGSRQAISAMGSRLALETLPVDPRRKAARLVVEQARMAGTLARVGVMHSFDYTFPYLSAAKNIVTVHDLNYLNHPLTFSLSQRAIRRVAIPLSLRLADRVVTISETARDEIVSRFPLSPDRVVVIHNGYSGLGAPAREHAAAVERESDRPYLLSVGTLKAHKNYPRLLEAFAALPDPGWRLVIVGRDDGMSVELRRRAAALGVTDRVTLRGFVSDDELRALYRGATLFVAPSLYEGFGMTVLEAMAQSTPVACSNLRVFREIAGEAAVYFDPEDPRSICDAIAGVVRDTDRRSRLVRMGHARAGRFTWDASARKVLRLYEELLGRRLGT